MNLLSMRIILTRQLTNLINLRADINSNTLRNLTSQRNHDLENRLRGNSNFNHLLTTSRISRTTDLTQHRTSIADSYFDFRILFLVLDSKPSYHPSHSP